MLWWLILEHHCNVTFCVSSSGPWAIQGLIHLMWPSDVWEWHLRIYSCVCMSVHEILLLEYSSLVFGDIFGLNLDFIWVRPPRSRTIYAGQLQLYFSLSYQRFRHQPWNVLQDNFMMTSRNYNIYSSSDFYWTDQSIFSGMSGLMSH